MANTPAFDLDAFGNTPMNCMTLVAGKAASATGHVLVGHNEDDGGHVVVRHGWVPPRDWEKGAVMPAEEGCALLPQVAHTLGYYWVEYRKDVMGLSNADGFVNERGVVIVSNSMGTSREGMANAACVNGATRPPAAPIPSPTGTRPSCSSWRAAATTWARACRTTPSPSCPTTSTCTG